MLLVFDIGNTNIVVGVFSDDRLLFEVRLNTHPGRTLDEYDGTLTTVLERKLGARPVFSQAIISSVVPPITPDIIAYITSQYGLEPLVVGPGLKTGLQLKVHEPQSVGADRVVNAVAAKVLFGAPALVIDFGTATTFDLVSAEGAYEGGVIIPGIKVALDSLVSRTAKLPRIELAWPSSVIGKTTVSAMQAGTVVGYGCLIEGLIERFIAEAGPIPHILATGGLGGLFAEHIPKIKRYEPSLTLQGLRLLAELNEG